MAELKAGFVALDKVVVVTNEHPLKDFFFTTRNLYKPTAAMTETIKANGRPDVPISVWPWLNPETNETELIVIDGNQRVINSRAAGLTQIPAEVHDNWTMQEAIAASTRDNALRLDNDFTTNCLLVARLTQPDNTGKPTGLDFKQAAVQFGKSHTWVRNHLKMHLFFPARIKAAIQKGQLSYTAAEVGLLDAELLKDKEALLKKFDEMMSAGGAINNADGKVQKRSPGGSVKAAKAGRQGGEVLSKNEWRAIATGKGTPEAFAYLIEVFVGDRTLEAARKAAEGELDWLVKPEKVKKSKKSKEEKENGSTPKTAIVPEEIDFNDLLG